MEVEMLDSCSERISWNFELNVIKEYLSRFYRSEFACLREYVANAIAAQHAAGVDDPVYVEITPERIVVEDRGTGISRQKFKEVFMWFGRSGNAELEGVQGRFGLGAKSFMMLTGDTGKVVMKTRSRETGETYTAVLTTTGAEIVEDEGKEDFSTRFEIYPESPLSPEKLSEFYNGVARHFDFSRIPVHVRACSDEPFAVYLTGKEKHVERMEDVSYYGTPVKYVENVFGVQNHEIEIMENNEVYELGILKTIPYGEIKSWSRERSAVVVGDVVVDKAVSEKNLFLRIKAEDGREVEIKTLGMRVKAPEPLPNRDEYRGLEDFIRVARLLYRVMQFKNKGYDRYLNSSPVKLASLGSKLDNLRQAVESVKEGAIKGWREYDERLLQAIERALPGFAGLERTLQILLTELPAYGVWGYVRANGRRDTVTVARVLLERHTSKVGYVRKRPDARKEQVMEEEDVYAVYTEDPAIIEFLEKNGVKEVKVRDRKTRVKVYSAWGSFEGGDAEYVGFESLIYRWNGGIFIYAERVSDLKGKYLPPCKVVVGSKKLYTKLKEVFGDFVMTYDEFEKTITETTLVTDGYDVMPLSEAMGRRVFSVVETTDTELLPLIGDVFGGVFAFVDVTDYGYAEKIFGGRKLEEWFKERWRDILQSWRIANITEERRKVAEMLHLLLTHGKDYTSIHKDLVEMACGYAGVKGRTVEELKELAKPHVERIVEKYGTLELGRFPIKAFMYRAFTYRGPVENELDGITASVRLVNPIIPSFTYGLAGEAGEEVRKLRELQDRLGIFGALVWHAENGGTLDKDGKAVMAEEIVRKHLPAFVRSKEDWGVLVKLAPRVSKRLALAALI